MYKCWWCSYDTWEGAHVPIGNDTNVRYHKDSTPVYADAIPTVVICRRCWDDRKQLHLRSSG